MDDGSDFASCGIRADDNLLNQCAHNSFLQSSIAVRVVPHRLEIAGQAYKFFLRRWLGTPSLQLLLDP